MVEGMGRGMGGERVGRDADEARVGRLKYLMLL